MLQVLVGKFLKHFFVYCSNTIVVIYKISVTIYSMYTCILDSSKFPSSMLLKTMRLLSKPSKFSTSPYCHQMKGLFPSMSTHLFLVIECCLGLYGNDDFTLHSNSKIMPYSLFIATTYNFYIFP